MRREKVYLAGLFVFLLYLILLCSRPLEGNQDVSVSFWGQISPFVSGEAGSGIEAPDFPDVFGTGIGAGMEFAWRFSNRFSLLGGIGYENYSGRTYEDISFDDLEVIPIYLGGKFHFLPKDSQWNPYLKMDVGAAHLSSVDISFGRLEGRYWDSSWVFLLHVGAGVEYRLEQWGVGLEVLPRYLGKPDSALGWLSDATRSWTVPIRLGVSYHF